jgi:hypothetical protein
MIPDLYTLAHKSLRQAVSSTAVMLGAAEPDGMAAVVAPTSAVIRELLDHASHEDEYIEPVLERFLPDVALEIAEQHAHLTRAIDAAHRQLEGLANEPTVAPGGPLALYRSFQRMAATNLVHLDYEETVVMPALWSTAPPEVLTDLMAAFNAAHPDASQLFHRWPDSLTRTERATFGIATSREALAAPLT